MRDLVTLTLVTIALAWCADHVTVKPLKPGQRHRMIFCTLLIIVLLAGFAGLRLLPLPASSISARARTSMRPRPVRYAWRMPALPIIMPPVGKSGPGR